MLTDNNIQTVVQIGAGAIGRGFLAGLWCGAGYETVFVDTDDELIERINAAGAYRLRLVGGTNTVQTVASVRAIWATDTAAVADAVAGCAFAATAVGARNMADVARRIIAPALPRRATPLNVLLCENGATVRGDFLAGLEDAAGLVGAVKTVVGRTVPEPGANSVDLIAESFAELPFNADLWQGEPPKVAGLVAVSGAAFPAYELRKRFLHNGGHALLAYHGALRGIEWLADCAEDAALVAELRGFWAEVCEAITRSAYSKVPIFAPDALVSFTDDLLTRFRLRDLGDTVARVARDPRRKLSRGERLTGAALFCLSHDVEPVYTRRAMIAALRFAGLDVAQADDAAASLLAV